jgi:hypothetical protein
MNLESGIGKYGIEYGIRFFFFASIHGFIDERDIDEEDM